MPFRITGKQSLSPHICCMDIEAPQVAKAHQPGQFVVLRVNETGERIPLTVVKKDKDKGTITLIFQVVGKTTMLLQDQPVESNILDVSGPLGNPSHLENFGTVVCVGGGIGAAPLYPIVQGLKKAGNKVITIIGAQKSDLLILEKEMTEASDALYISTDDGSKGHHGLVTGPLKDILDSGQAIGFIMAVGPLPMMRSVSDLTKPYGIKTMVSLNSIMVDGTGMCGSCRVNVGGKSRFTCLEGPEFNSHEVDFDNFSQRLKAYREQESCSRACYTERQRA